MKERTLFEKIIEGEIPSHLVSRGEGYYAFLDIFPRREGHTLVIPLRGVQRLADLTNQEISQLFCGVKHVQSLLGAKYSTTDFTVCLHDGPLSGQEVPHVHIHVIPRTKGDGGLTLMSMWPKTKLPSTPNHEDLAFLSKQLQELDR